MKKFGLPLEYNEYPEYFDAHNVVDDTDKKNEAIEKLLRAHNVKFVFDLTCGTGSQVFFLKKLRYDIIGSDLSAKLIEIAKEKASKEKLKIEFFIGDMRNIKIERKFDACITMFNAIGHLTKVGFAKTMKNIFNHLKDNGVYIFDIFNINAINTTEDILNFGCQSNKRLSDSQMLSSQVSTIDRKNGLLTSYDSILIQESCNKPKFIKNVFTLQIYSSEELEEMLRGVGFKKVKFYDIYGHEFIKTQTLSMMIVAMK